MLAAGRNHSDDTAENPSAPSGLPHWWLVCHRVRPVQYVLDHVSLPLGAERSHRRAFCLPLGSVHAQALASSAVLFLCFVNANHVSWNASRSRGFRSRFAATDAADVGFFTQRAIKCFRIKRRQNSLQGSKLTLTILSSLLHNWVKINFFDSYGCHIW